MIAENAAMTAEIHKLRRERAKLKRRAESQGRELAALKADHRGTEGTEKESVKSVERKESEESDG